MVMKTFSKKKAKSFKIIGKCKRFQVNYRCRRTADEEEL